MTRDDVMRETLAHKTRVGVLLMEVIALLGRRAVNHDNSKFSQEEFEAFAAETPNLRQLTYGSDEYKAALERLGPALKHHYAQNDHHPEYGVGGFAAMDLIQQMEMLADWKAATERHDNGSLYKSIVGNAKRFGYDCQTANVLARTAHRMGWITFSELAAVLEQPGQLATSDA